jgi:hypothetical protein
MGELGEEISVDDGASGLPGRWNRRALRGLIHEHAAQAESDV